MGFGSTLAVVVAAAHAVGATAAQTSSWVAALCLGIAATSAWLSLRSRMPVVTAWSLAGAALIAAGPRGTDLHQAVGAFMLSGALMVASGVIAPLGHAIGRLPSAIAGAMLAGVLLRFVLGLFQVAPVAPALVLPLLLLFLALRQVTPASAVLIVILAGIGLAPLLGFAIPMPRPEFATLVWVRPDFTPQALIGLGLPLFVVTMATQQIAGFAVLRVSGYPPPVRPILVSTGIASIVGAAFGGHSTNLSAVTAAICTGPEAHPDPRRRWLTGPLYALCYLALAASGSSLVALFAALPPPLVATITGLALLAPLSGALHAGFAPEADRFTSALTFGVTASGASLLGIGAPFWGLVAGVIALAIQGWAGRMRSGKSQKAGRLR